MLKHKKKLIFFTSLMTLIPMFAGCILWTRLPDLIATHFGADNRPNGFSSKGFTVFGIPVLLVLMHLFLLFLASADPKAKNIGRKPFGILFWIFPLTSILTGFITYAIALGIPLDVGFIVTLFVGILFLALGNYFPKVRQNYSFGIKTPWTLNDSENWNRTNQMAGWCMILAGIVIVMTSFLHNPYILFGVLGIYVMIPYVYSYIYYRRHSTGKES